MPYTSSHSGPEIDSAVQMLGQVQSARDATKGDLAEVKTLAAKVDTNTAAVETRAITVIAKADQVSASAQVVEQSRSEVVAARAATETAASTAVDAANTAVTKSRAATASEQAAAQSQIAAGLSEQVSAENAASTGEGLAQVKALAQEVQKDSATTKANASLAATSAQTAVGLVDGYGNRHYTRYADMVADTQVRPGAVGIVDGDPDPNLDGWYRWRDIVKKWIRWEQQPLAADTGFADDKLFSLLDANNLETWLGVNAIDGGPTKHSERLLRLMFGMLLQSRTGYLAALTDSNGLMTDLAIRDTDGQFDEFVMDRMAPRINQRIQDKLESAGRTGYLFALRDANRVLTDLCVTDTDGQFPDFVVDRLAPRIAKRLAASDWFPNDKYVDANGDVQRVLTSMSTWSGWGSSTIDEWSELSTLASSFGATYYNGGNGATELQHNLAQMGARPALLLPAGGAIPASGQVVVACSNLGKNQYFKATAGTLQGVPGTLTCTADDWIFTRAQDGSAVAVATEQPFIPTQGYLQRGGLWVMQEGKNNINNNTPLAQIIAWHKQAFNWNSALSKRVIVMTQFGNTGWAGSEGIQKVQQLNDFIRATYTDNVFDLQGYLCSSQVWTDTGVTPTDDDLKNQAAGCLAASLSRDNQAHMNAKTRTAAAEKVKQKLLDMGWFKA